MLEAKKTGRMARLNFEERGLLGKQACLRFI